MSSKHVTARVGAVFAGGTLRPERTLNLREGEHVEIIVVRPSDPSRWDLTRLGASQPEDSALAQAGLGAWADELDREDRR